MIHYMLVFAFLLGDTPQVYVAEYPDMESCRVAASNISDHLVINSGMKVGCSAYRDKADGRPGEREIEQ